MRDNPAFDATRREHQFGQLARVTAGLAKIGRPLIFELLVQMMR